MWQTIALFCFCMVLARAAISALSRLRRLSRKYGFFSNEAEAFYLRQCFTDDVTILLLSWCLVLLLGW